MDQWVVFLHLFIVHAALATALVVACDVHVNGAPTLSRIPGLLTSSAVLGGLVGLLTAHAHSHYLNYIGGINALIYK
jgi:hypothetical protein